MNHAILILSVALSATASARDLEDAPTREQLTRLTLLQSERPNLWLTRGLLIGGGVGVGLGLAALGGGLLQFILNGDFVQLSAENINQLIGGLMIAGS